MAAVSEPLPECCHDDGRTGDRHAVAVAVTAPALTVVSVLVLGITLTWTFFSMRSVMNDTGSRWWVPAYTALGAAGFLAGAWSYNALS